MKNLFLILALTFVNFTSNAQTKIDGINYYLDSATSTASVTRSVDCSGSISIPPVVVYNEKAYKVINIEREAFYACGNLESITIPSTVTSIKSKTFYFCLSLEKVILPNSITSIGDEAFYYCCELTSINIPHNVNSIGDNAFKNCQKLTSIALPSSVTTIGKSAFDECPNLTTVIVGNPNPVAIESTTISNRRKANLFVPKGSLASYKTKGYWSTFKNIMELDNGQNTSIGDINGDGDQTITDVMKLVGFILGSDVQIYKQCPDNHHPHLIDLGLPSGTKWACCNVGANAPENYGEYFQWGEVKEKNYYDWSTYIHCDGTERTCHDIGTNIAGTQYDVAHVKWGGSWVMPSLEQAQELIDNCDSYWITINGVSGRSFRGPNGAVIFFPAAGCRFKESYSIFTYGFYWLSTQDHSTSGDELVIYDDEPTCIGEARVYGQSVRPVWVVK